MGRDSAGEAMRIRKPKCCTACGIALASRGLCGPCRYQRHGKAWLQKQRESGRLARCPRCQGDSLATNTTSWGSFNRCTGCGYGNKVVDYSYYDRRGLPRPALEVKP
jgi:hypothetical protein